MADAELELHPVVAPPEEFKAATAAADLETVDEDQKPVAHRLAAEDPDNPFGIEGCGCAEFVRSRTSTTADPEVARSFVERRTSTGSELHGLLPEDAVALDCTMRYAIHFPLDEGALFRSSEMEDKWDIYRLGERLAFCRSWTGKLVFVAEMVFDKTTLTFRRIWVGAELAEPDPKLALRQFDFLLRSHVLGRTAPHPLPADLADEPQTIADYSFHTYGRNCSFASFGDTIAAPDFGADVLAVS